MDRTTGWTDSLVSTMTVWQLSYLCLSSFLLFFLHKRGISRCFPLPTSSHSRIGILFTAVISNQKNPSFSLRSLNPPHPLHNPLSLLLLSLNSHTPSYSIPLTHHIPSTIHNPPTPFPQLSTIPYTPTPFPQPPTIPYTPTPFPQPPHPSHAK